MNDTCQTLWGACVQVMIRIGEIVELINIFVHSTFAYPIILGQPFIIEFRMETKVLDNGTHVAKLKSKDGKREVQFPTVQPGNLRKRATLKELPMTLQLERIFQWALHLMRWASGGLLKEKMNSKILERSCALIQIGSSLCGRIMVSCNSCKTCSP